MTVSRRAAIKALALPLLTPAVAAGCASLDPVRIAVIWSGKELKNFQDVIKKYPDDRTTIFSVGDDINAFLARPLANAASPDVAIVSRPGLVQKSWNRLIELAPQRTPEPWRGLVSMHNVTKGVWVKIAHKSLLWYRDTPELHQFFARPKNWDAWVQKCQEMAGRRTGPAPLAIGAADGWVLTDWFENVLLSLDPTIFERLLNSPGSNPWAESVIETTLRRLADIWSIPRVFSGGRDRALTMQFEESIREVFAHRRAFMVAGTDFAWPVIASENAAPAGVARLPQVRNSTILVGGDVAVALSDRGKNVVEWFNKPEGIRALRTWASRGGFLSPNKLANDKDALPQRLMPQLFMQALGPGGIAFDLSDRLGDRIAGGDGQGLWGILTDFFAQVAEVGDPARVDRAVSGAAGALEELGRTAGRRV